MTYKYTAKPDIVLGLKAASDNRADPRARLQFAKQYVDSFAAFNVFCRFFPTAEYVSDKKVSTITIQGIDFPVKYFICKKIEEK